MVTGLSGAGKTTALKALEDMGWEAVDNLPLALLDGLLHAGGGIRRPLALGIDVRTRDFDVDAIKRVMAALRDEDHVDANLVFLDSDTEVLMRRFTETRRRHPLAVDLPLLDGIQLERQMLKPLRDVADVVMDTTRRPPRELRADLETKFALAASPGMTVCVTSFGFRDGLPRDADLVFDARFLRNPHYVPDLKPFTGVDARVAAYVEADPDWPGFFDGITRLVAPLLPRYEAEGKSYLTIAVGCTGGKHRSVFTVERLARWLRDRDVPVTVRHRDVDPQALPPGRDMRESP
ncbi:ATP-binding protein ManX [Caenispirillum salinarum AK4]|uniref:ATP-binding protein ManX n=1 Tax=Caenispirillum salinarum AK4 TaxID=1238182 RepID=K9HNL2_9PROT|nr:ATP-binding protein ManX [Caenispirillum salinarum AK4]